MFLLKLALALTVVSGALSRPYKEESTTFNSGATEFIVVFKKGYDVVKSADKIFKQVIHFKTPPKVRSLYRYVIQGVALAEVSQEVLDWLEEQDFVAYVEESVKLSSQSSTCTTSTSDATDLTNTMTNWGLDRITERYYTKNDYDYRPTGLGDGSVVYVIDSGIHMSHDEFDSTLFSNLFTVNANNYADCTGHGTAVAGIIAGQQLGAANATTVKNVKVTCSDDATIGNILTGLDQIYADVISNSYQDKCVISFSYANDVDTDSLHTAIQNITSSTVKCVFVAAAGNDDTSTYYYPAAYSETISVGAINRKIIDPNGARKAKRACYSNYGSSVDIYAPGSNMYTAHNSGNGKVKKVKGTSYAAPFVSAVSAILLQRSDVTAATLKSKLISLATTTPVIHEVGSGSHSRILYVD